jgi:hypothetical protein
LGGGGGGARPPTRSHHQSHPFGVRPTLNEPGEPFAEHR